MKIQTLAGVNCVGGEKDFAAETRRSKRQLRTYLNVSHSDNDAKALDVLKLCQLAGDIK
jgi:hypothetical protein